MWFPSSRLLRLAERFRRPSSAAAKPQPEPDPQPEPQSESHAPQAPSARGLDWGTFLFRFDYDYVPRHRAMEASAGGRRIEARIRRDETVIRQCLAEMGAQAEAMARIAVEPDPNDPSQPCWANGNWMPAVDAAVIYTLIAQKRPATFFEVGSGNSTKFARRAIRDHQLDTRIVSIDPAPRAEVDAICDEVIRAPIESIDIGALAARVRPGDVVFVDNSHRGFQSSDVTVCLMELMPALPPGTFFGLHDICLPYDYDPVFVDYFYNEQYYLGMYLLGGAISDHVIMPTYFLRRDPVLGAALAQVLAPLKIPQALIGGSSFWVEFGARAAANDPTPTPPLSKAG